MRCTYTALIAKSLLPAWLPTPSQIPAVHSSWPDTPWGPYRSRSCSDITSMSQKLRRPSLFVGVTGSPELGEGAEVKCRGGGQLLPGPPLARARPLVSDMVLLRPPGETKQIRLCRASPCKAAVCLTRAWLERRERAISNIQQSGFSLREQTDT